MNANETLMEALANSGMYRDYERAYSEATGMPVSLRPVETWQLPLHGKRKENPFCAMMAEKSRSCAACLAMQEKLAQAAKDGPCAMTCAYGLCELAVPVKLGGETIGFLQTGQVMRQKPTAGAFDRALAKAEKLGLEWDTAKARNAFFLTPVASQRKIESVTNLLSIFADHLSMKSNQLAVQQSHAEPPVIVKAKKFRRRSGPRSTNIRLSPSPMCRARSPPSTTSSAPSRNMRARNCLARIIGSSTPGFIP